MHLSFPKGQVFTAEKHLLDYYKSLLPSFINQIFQQTKLTRIKTPSNLKGPRESPIMVSLQEVAL